MELWIRSQDKEDLIKVDNLGLAYLGKYNFVDKIGDIHREEYHICQFEENCHTTLGYYKTKERALKVLDEIEYILKPKYILNTSSIKPDGDFYEENGMIFQKYNANARIEELSTFVYEMPKE